MLLQFTILFPSASISGFFLQASATAFYAQLHMLSFECRVSPKACKTRGWPRSLQLLNPHFLWPSGPSAPGQGLSRKPQYSFLPKMIHLVMSCLDSNHLRPCWPQVKTRVFCFFSFVQIKNMLSVKTSKVLYDCILLLIC